jgi:hypothetical protein
MARWSISSGTYLKSYGVFSVHPCRVLIQRFYLEVAFATAAAIRVDDTLTRAFSVH